LCITKNMKILRQFVTQTVLVLGLVFTLAVVAPTALAMGGDPLPLDQPAPTFTLPSNGGEGEVSLSDYKGKWVVLYFYPQDFTPGCTVEAQRFQRDLPQYIKKNTQIIGVSVDSVDSHAEFCDSEGLKFPLLADEDGSVSKAYGSWMSYFSLRHTYLIDPDGILRERYVKVKPIIHSEEVLARLEELQAAS